MDNQTEPDGLRTEVSALRIEVGRLQGELTERSVQLARARQDQDWYMRRPTAQLRRHFGRARRALRRFVRR
jgi:hypothetical protein